MNKVIRQFKTPLTIVGFAIAFAVALPFIRKILSSLRAINDDANEAEHTRSDSKNQTEYIEQIEKENKNAGITSSSETQRIAQRIYEIVNRNINAWGVSHASIQDSKEIYSLIKSLNPKYLKQVIVDYGIRKPSLLYQPANMESHVQTITNTNDFSNPYDFATNPWQIIRPYFISALK